MKPTNTTGFVPQAGVEPATYTMEYEHAPFMPAVDEEDIPLPFDDGDEEDFDTEEYIATLTLPDRYKGVITLKEYQDLTRGELDERYFAENAERMNDIHGRMMDEDFKNAVSIEEFRAICHKRIREIYGEA